MTRRPPTDVQRGNGEVSLHREEVQFIEQYFHGPIPPSGELERYESILPGAADRIIRMAEERQASATAQGEHRRALESRVIDSNIKRERTGQWFALIVSLSFLGGGVFCAFLGQTTVAVVTIGSTVVSLAGVFITGKVINSKQLKEKRNPEA